jgi:hypothetical protein
MALVSATRAREAVQRLINSHFGNHDRARCSVPARPECDDDLVAMRYIDETEAVLAEQQRAAEQPRKPEGQPPENEGCWGRVYIAGRADIVGQRLMDDGSIEYLCHNEGLCSPYYVATNGKPTKPAQPPAGSSCTCKGYETDINCQLHGEPASTEAPAGDVVEKMLIAYWGSDFTSFGGKSAQRMAAALAVAREGYARLEDVEKAIKEEYAFTDGHGSTWWFWFERIRNRLAKPSGQTDEQKVAQIITEGHGHNLPVSQVAEMIVAALRGGKEGK